MVSNGLHGEHSGKPGIIVDACMCDGKADLEYARV